MRKLKQIGLAVALMSALSTGAMAGIIDCPTAPTPPPPDSQSATATSETTTTSQSSDPVVDLALVVLSVILAF